MVITPSNSGRKKDETTPIKNKYMWRICIILTLRRSQILVTCLSKETQTEQI